MESINKVDYKVADIPTRAVVLFPERAQVFRDIKDIALKPGINEVTISGLSPTLDEESIKVESAGSAVITDISVEALPNPDNFKDVETDEDSSSSSDESDDNEDHDSEDLCAAQLRVRELRDEMWLIKDAIDSVNNRQRIMLVRSNAADTMEQDKGVRLAELLAAYKNERAALSRERLEAAKLQREVQKKLDAALAHVQALRGTALRESRERRKAKRRQREKEQRRRADLREERKRVRRERAKFWPRYCYSIRVILDVNTMTPISSRRASIASETAVRAVTATATDDEKPTAAAQLDNHISCSLCVSYVTSAAGWTPSYDLQLSTTGTAAAMLCFDAKISNQTSETWRGCAVSLSTADAALAGVDADLPELMPWRIRLVGARAAGAKATATSTLPGAATRRTNTGRPGCGVSQPDAEAASSTSSSSDHDDDDVSTPRRKGKKKASTRLETTTPVAAPAPPAAVAGFGADLAPEAIDFDDSLVEESGMTTVYDLPGLQTLAPRTPTSKQRVARISFAHVTLSHHVVAKLRPVAYLQARLKNSSRLTLLRASAGLTLDPSSGARSYRGAPPATSSRSTSASIPPSKSRTQNPKSDARPRDSFQRRAARWRKQQDDSAGAGEGPGAGQRGREAQGGRGDAARAGGGGAGRGDGRDRDWGKATAQLRKGGEVCWDVRLNAGKMVKLWLEYAVSAPTGDVAVEC
ncbi:hypothetical protein BBAD15_g6242 [Beauveria bassiana D1-5]|uniref:Mucoidy inhibitor A n=1 Tax=Beauveria bassiana D1-5 TaxID=1245745 RepID=A0A0A2VPY7_BEABA|nr:hypothetical protein BBAD15_g6242 [Beauveria bassiana D1-5]